MDNIKTVLHGEIYLCDFGSNDGSIQNGIRPVIVLQDDRFSKHSPTTIVAPITTVVKKRYLPSHVYIGKRFGLYRNSMVLLEQIRTINKSELKRYIGRVTSDKVLNLIWKSVKQTMGFWDFNRNKGSNSHCLCNDCLNKCKKEGKYFISRINYQSRSKDTCELCKTKYGFNYSFKAK